MKRSLLVESNVPVPVRAALERACQDCHSENTVWPWYSHIPPVSWQIHTDVERGRAFMDLSKWNDYTDSERKGFTAAIGAAIQTHLMPPPKYVWMHREAKLSSDELELIRAWALAPHKTNARDALHNHVLRLSGTLEESQSGIRIRQSGLSGMASNGGS